MADILKVTFPTLSTVLTQSVFFYLSLQLCDLTTQTFLQERLTAWLVSVKLSFDKRGSKVTGGWSSEMMIKMLNMGTDLTRPFEYLLATGNLQSKTGPVQD